MTKIILAGIDGSLKNFAVARMSLDLDTMDLDVVSFDIFQTEPDKNKSVRSSSDYLRRAQFIAEGMAEKVIGCTGAFLEVPSGGQDYKSVMGFGIVIGIYAAITPILAVPTIEVSPAETKLAALGTKTASKQEMIAWAYELYPNAPWRRYSKNGKGYLKGEPTLDNEHLADAVAIVRAGIKTPAFRQTLAILRATAASSAKAA